MTKKVMELIDPHTGLMQCKVCGAEHHGHMKPGSDGKFYPQAWRCQNGCETD